MSDPIDTKNVTKASLVKMLESAKNGTDDAVAEAVANTTEKVRASLEAKYEELLQEKDQLVSEFRDGLEKAKSKLAGFDDRVEQVAKDRFEDFKQTELGQKLAEVAEEVEGSAVKKRNVIAALALVVGFGLGWLAAAVL